MEQEKIWVSIEGLIGAGKSTLIQSVLPYLREHYGPDQIAIVPEPVEQWTRHMEKFSDNPARFSFLFQTYAFHTRQETFNRVFRKNPDAHIFISERSPLTDRFVFWEANRELHALDSLESETYPLLWSTWIELYPLKLSRMIYLDLKTDTCAKRIKERARNTEVDFVSESYQNLLREKHLQLFHSNIVPHHVLESDKNYRDEPDVAKEFAQKIIKLIEK